MIRPTLSSDTGNLAEKPDEPTIVDVCVATRRRPVLLGRLLDSLAAQELPPNLRFRVIVVENDDQPSAEPVVAAGRAAGLDIVYDVEPERNISLARNRSFAHVSPNAEFIATIDDDSTACPQWLALLVKAARDYQADGVLGAVRRVLPPDAPRYFEDSDVFQMYNPVTGATEWLVYNTGNALLRREVVMARPGPFNVEFGLTGGEDTDLFFSLCEQGAQIVWCREAQVNEGVLPERVSLRWLLPRAFREGVTYYKVYGRWTLSSATPFPRRWISFVLWAAKTMVSIVVRWTIGLVSHRQRALAVAELKNLFFNSGIAARTAGLRIEPHHR